MQGRRNQGWGGVTIRTPKMTSSPLASAIETLAAVEARIRAIEDVVTSGDALEMPPALRPNVGRGREDELRVLEAALLIGTIAGRMNLRLGAIERALDRRASPSLNDSIPLRSPKRLKALQASERFALEDDASRSSFDGSRSGLGPRPRAN